ncbi:hypothetical protein P9705_001244 [Enterococcus faecalis]|nr:hypothetical protein [Enterococcus faecalis]
MYVEEKNIADLDLVKVLLDSEMSAYEIESKTGITRAAISKYRNEKSNINNMPLGVAIKLTKISINRIDILSAEILDKMKHSKPFEYVVVTDKKNNKALRDRETNNYASVYSYKEDGEGYYGVYSDIFGMSRKIDNRTNDDKEIKAALRKILKLGVLVDRKEYLENSMNEK